MTPPSKVAEIAGLDERDVRNLLTVWEKTGGRAWEPPAPDYPWLVDMVEAGFLRRCDMRCGFEAFKDSGLTWTAAGKLAVAHLQSQSQEQPEC